MLQRKQFRAAVLLMVVSVLLGWLPATPVPPVQARETVPISQGKPALASSEFLNDDTVELASHANDGNLDSWWRPYSGLDPSPFWWQVDLESTVVLTGFTTLWEWGDNGTYTVEVWDTDVMTSTVAAGMVAAGLSETTLSLPEGTTGRYVRVTMDTPAEEVPLMVREVAVNGRAGPLPVIFIHGITGSGLYDKKINKNLWPTTVFADKNTRRLTLYQDDRAAQGYPDVVATDVIRAIPPFITVYKPLLDRLMREGYTEYQVANIPERRTTAGCDLSQATSQPRLFVFAYDWRQNNVDTAQRLKDYIGCVQRFYPGTKVNIVAHSMGGLIARRYILGNPDDHNVNALVAIASPWLGAPKALLTLETGELLDHQWLIVRRETLQEMAGSFASAAQLVPSSDYFAIGAKPPLREEGWDWNQNGSPYETYDYLAMVRMLNQRYGRGLNPGTIGWNFHSFATPKGVQDNWRNPADTTGVKYYMVWGQTDKDRTVIGLEALRQNECEETPTVGMSTACLDWKQVRLVKGKGDETVPSVSASRRNNGLDFNALHADVYDVQTGLKGHTTLTQNPEVLDYMVASLRAADGLASPPPAPATPPAPVAQTVAELRTVQIKNTVALTVTDSQGNWTHMVDGVVEGELPDVELLRLGQSVAQVELPDQPDYTLTFQAERAVPMGLSIHTGTADTTSQIVRYMDLLLPAQVDAQLRLTAQTDVALRYDADHNGTFETHIPPSVSRQGSEAQDQEPPHIETRMAQRPDGMQVTFNALDNESGVERLLYSLDGQQFQHYGGPVLFDPQQGQMVYAFADDRAGNRTPVVHTAGMLLTTTQTLTTGVRHPSGFPRYYPVGVALVDIDHDTLADLLVANQASGTLTVRRGNGNGTFQAPLAEYSVDYPNGNIVAADFNNDQHIDVAVVDSRNVVIFLGRGDGTFAPPRYQDSEALEFQALATGDLNSDGRLDLVLGFRDTMAKVMLGRGDGTFQPPLILPSSGTCRHLVTACAGVTLHDLNRDGALDLLYTNSVVNVRLGRGDGTFHAPTTYLTDTVHEALSVADVDGDQIADLVVGRFEHNMVAIMRGTGTGSFLPPVTYPTGWQPTDVQVVDVNADSHADVLTVNSEGENMSVLLGKGDGTLGEAVHYPLGKLPIASATGDLNNDGWPDVAVINHESDTVQVLRAH